MENSFFSLKKQDSKENPLTQSKVQQKQQKKGKNEQKKFSPKFSHNILRCIFEFFEITEVFELRKVSKYWNQISIGTLLNWRINNFFLERKLGLEEKYTLEALQVKLEERTPEIALIFNKFRILDVKDINEDKFGNQMFSPLYSILTLQIIRFQERILKLKEYQIRIDRFQRYWDRIERRLATCTCFFVNFIKQQNEQEWNKFNLNLILRFWSDDLVEESLKLMPEFKQLLIQKIQYVPKFAEALYTWIIQGAALYQRIKKENNELIEYVFQLEQNDLFQKNQRLLEKIHKKYELGFKDQQLFDKPKIKTQWKY